MCPGTDTDVPAAEEAAGRPRISPRAIIFAVVILVVGVVLVVSTIARGDVGVLKVDDTGVSKVLNGVDADASVTFPLILAEGGDVVHESDHVFKSLLSLMGVGKVLLATDGSTVTVEYESAVITEARIQQALAEAGYTQPAAGGTPAQ